MSMPPAALAMITGRPAARSISMLRVELALDLQPSSMRTRPTFRPSGPGLVRDERHADHLLGEALGFVRRLRQLDAAALAPARPRGICALTTTTFVAEPLRDGRRIVCRECDFAAGDRNAKARED
jgi:hypothetical protein